MSTQLRGPCDRCHRTAIIRPLGGKHLCHQCYERQEHWVSFIAQVDAEIAHVERNKT